MSRDLSIFATRSEEAQLSGLKQEDDIIIYYAKNVEIRSILPTWFPVLSFAERTCRA